MSSAIRTISFSVMPTRVTSGGDRDSDLAVPGDGWRPGRRCLRVVGANAPCPVPFRLSGNGSVDRRVARGRVCEPGRRQVAIGVPPAQHGDRKRGQLGVDVRRDYHDVRPRLEQAALLADQLRVPVLAAYLSAARPTVAEAVARLRTQTRRPVAVASYLLAPGHFSDQLGECGADWVTEPLGGHPALAGVVIDRYRAAAKGR